MSRIYNTIGPICQDNEATIENARDMAQGLDWTEYEIEPQTIGHARFEEAVNGLYIYYDYAADYYFFVYPLDSSAACENAGWIESRLESEEYNLHVYHAPNADLDGEFWAYCLDEDEMLKINGWQFRQI